MATVETVVATIDVCSKEGLHQPHLRLSLFSRPQTHLWCLGQYVQGLQTRLALVRIDGDHEDLLVIGPHPWDGNDDPAAALQSAAAGITWATAYLHSLVAKVRGNGLSYGAVGRALGVSRQAAWERFTR